MTSHYAGPGSTAPSWTYNEISKTWARNVPAFGGLVAVEESGKQAVLQLRDLQGNIIGTASPNETVSKPITTERSTEYGVPTSEKPKDTYNWLGATGITQSLTSGSIVQDGATYVPQIGAPLQTEGIPLPPEPETAVPYVLTVAPIYVARNETWAEAYEHETPAGNIPEPEGEGPLIRKVEGRVEFEVETRDAVAALVYERSFNMYPSAAIALGDALFSVGQSFSDTSGQYKIPTWAFRVLEHTSPQSLDDIASELVTMGTSTEVANALTDSDHFVTVHFFGHLSRRGILWWVSVEGWEVYDDPE